MNTKRLARAALLYGRFEGVGFCDVTHAGEGASCAIGESKGSWVTDDLTQCYMRCAGCARCSFISFNRADRDCSWYAACAELRSANASVSGYVGAHVTYRVRADDGTLHNHSDAEPPPPSPPPPSPPPWVDRNWCMSPLARKNTRW